MSERELMVCTMCMVVLDANETDEHKHEHAEMRMTLEALFLSYELFIRRADGEPLIELGTLAASAIAFGKTCGTDFERDGRDVLTRAALVYFESVKAFRKARGLPTGDPK